MGNQYQDIYNAVLVMVAQYCDERGMTSQDERDAVAERVSEAAYDGAQWND